MTKRFLIICTLIISIILSNYNTITNAQSNMITYTGNIEILGFNKLIAYPEYALTSKNNRHLINDAEHLTTNEFYKILQSLYVNNYIIVNLSEAYDLNSGTQKDIQLPAGKKPIVILFENLTYDTQVRSSGFVDKLIVDRTETIATYTSRKSINDRIAYDNECITIFENFVNNNPKFCLNGARATICVNNDNGLFGYKTVKTNATSKFEIKRAIKVAKKLKSLGYSFACSGFENNEILNELNFASEVNTWNNQTTLITGSTKVYISDNALDSDYKQELLASNGFTMFLSHNDTHPITITTIGGKALRENNNLTHLFDPLNVYDHVNRTLTYITE